MDTLSPHILLERHAENIVKGSGLRPRLLGLPPAASSATHHQLPQADFHKSSVHILGKFLVTAPFHGMTHFFCKSSFSIELWVLTRVPFLGPASGHKNMSKLQRKGLLTGNNSLQPVIHLFFQPNCSNTAHGWPEPFPAVAPGGKRD